MADLLVPDGDTDRPSKTPARGAVPPASAASTASRTFSVADVPEWVVEQVDQTSYPTRMARRRALEAARIVNDWKPDPTVTAPVLTRVEDELSRLLGRRYEPRVEPEEDKPDADAVAAADAVALADVLGGTTGGHLLPSEAPRRRFGRAHAAVAGALAAVLVGGGVVWATHGGPASHHAPAVATVASQQVVALALSDDGLLTGVSLLAAGSGEPQQVLVPSRLLLDVPGAGRLPVAQSMAPGQSAPAAALADALQIRVAGTWVVSSSALASLVDGVGGVTVDVDVDVPQGSGAGAAILVAAGDHVKLDGAQAAAFAQLLVGDEPEAARLARQEQVVRAVLAALPTDPARRRAVVVGLPGAPTGAVLDAVLATTGQLQAAAASDSLPSIVLPTHDIDTGGSVTAYGLDTAAALQMVAARLPGAQIPDAGHRLRVLVQNGVGTPGLGDAARSRLVAAGLSYLGGGNVDGFGVKESLVLLPDGSSVNRAKGLAVAKALGLPATALRISDNAPTVADVVVMLGSDFHAA